MPRSLLTRSVTLRTVATVVALAATVPAVGARAETIPSVHCAGKKAPTKNDTWQVFGAPTFLAPNGLGTPPQEITSYAVAPNKPLFMVVTNGNSIQVSRNGGCSWTPSLRLDQVPSNPNVTLSGQTSRIVGLYIAPRTNRIYATAEELETGATVGRPHLIVSDDGSASSWHLSDNGLPPIGHPLRIQAHPTSPSTMYFSFSGAREPEGGATCPPAPLPCDSQQTTPGLLWGSTDGGATWSRRTDPGDLNGASAIKYFSIEDDDPSGRTLWVVANGLLRKSTNSGASFVAPDGLNQSAFTFTAVESINKTTSNPVQVVAFSNGGEMIRLQKGKGWIRSYVPFRSVESVSQRPAGDIAVATTPDGGGLDVWRIFGPQFVDYDVGVDVTGKPFKLTYGWQAISPQTSVTANGQISAAVASNGASTFFLRDKRRVLRFLGTSRDKETSEAVPDLIGAPPPPLGRITPSNLDLALPLGKSKVVDYTVTLPPAPTPIEVYLLIDNSGSMQPLIEDLKANLAQVAKALVRSGVPIRMGVGQINVQPENGIPVFDDPTTPEDESKGKPIYERLRPIGPPDGSFFRALSKINGDGGNGDEAQVESLWQSIVGDGVSPYGLGPLIGYSVQPGQQAGFGDGADIIKVIVHATDEKFSTNINNAHNNPQEVANTLKSAGVLQIGLSQGSKDAYACIDTCAQNDHGSPYKYPGWGLAKMAQATGAVAGPGGVDCDGDGRVQAGITPWEGDVLPGKPLVCPQNYGLDKTLVNLLKSIADPQTLGLTVSRGPTVRNITQTAWPINAKSATKKGFKVTYSCVGVAPGVYPTDLRAGLRDIVIAKATATVTCGNPPLPGSRPEAAAVQIPPPNPQPAPAPIVPANPIAQPQVNSQVQANPQAGMAEQKEKQVQLAAAENDIPDEDQLAFSALPQDHPVPAPAVALAGMAMATAAGVALALRRRAQQSVARVTY
jgi:hypothetical protein